MSVEPEAAERPVERFHRLCELVVARLPFGLDSIVAPTFLGFAVLNSFTFAVDLVLLTVEDDGKIVTRDAYEAARTGPKADAGD